MMNFRDLEFFDKLQGASDRQGAQAWLALGREGRELYWKVHDTYQKTKCCGLCGQPMEHCHLACTETYVED